MSSSKASATTQRRVARKRIGRNLYERTNLCGSKSYVADYIDPSDGRQRRKTLSARTRAEARREQADLISKLNRGEVVSPSRLTFAEVWAERKRALEGQVASGERAERTLEGYDYHYRARLKGPLGGKPIQKITTNMVGDLIAKWRRDGLKPWTIKGSLVAMNRVFGLGVRRGYIAENPISRLEQGERPRVERKEHRILTHAEIASLLDKAPKSYGAIIATAIFSGLRISELLGLRWCDLDFEAGLIRVRNQLSRATKAKPARLLPLKTDAARRDVILLPQLAELLKKHRQAAFARGHASAESFVFCTQKGTPLYYKNATERGLAVATEKAGIGHLPFHWLRHTFVSYLTLELGFDPVRVARQVGHKRASFTLDTYAWLFEQANHAGNLRARMAASAFGGLLDGR